MLGRLYVFLHESGGPSAAPERDGRKCRRQALRKRYSQWNPGGDSCSRRPAAQPLERKYNDNNSWNTNAISPGTYFMNKLNNSLQIYSESVKIKCIISDSNERGEGEHKILQYIKGNHCNGKICKNYLNH